MLGDICRSGGAIFANPSGSNLDLGAGPFGPRLYRGSAPVVRPAWALSWRCKSSRELVTATEANRKASAREGALEEVGSESVSRRTEIGWEAQTPCASGLRTAKRK